MRMSRKSRFKTLITSASMIALATIFTAASVPSVAIVASAQSV